MLLCQQWIYDIIPVCNDNEFRFSECVCIVFRIYIETFYGTASYVWGTFDSTTACQQCVWHKQSMHSMLPCDCVCVFEALTAHSSHNIHNNTIIFILMLLNGISHPSSHPSIDVFHFSNSFNNFIQLYPIDSSHCINFLPFIHSFIQKCPLICEDMNSRQVYIRRPFSRLKSNMCIFIIRLRI